MSVQRLIYFAQQTVKGLIDVNTSMSSVYKKSFDKGKVNEDESQILGDKHLGEHSQKFLS